MGMGPGPCDLGCFFGFFSWFVFRCRDCARRRRYFLVVEQESTQRNRPCCSRPSAVAPGNLPQATDPARRGTPAALKRSGQTAAASQWLKLLRHLTKQPPDRLPEAGVIRRELGVDVDAQPSFKFLEFLNSQPTKIHPRHYPRHSLLPTPASRQSRGGCCVK